MDVDDIKNLTPVEGILDIEPARTDNKTTQMMVIGVGGGGGNAVKHMYENGAINCVRYVACNTDSQALETSGIPIKLLLGPTVTHGGGAGNKPEVARLAAEESAEDIKSLLTTEPKPNMVFITAGMGGGTGTGAAPVVARISKELGILTVGIVTTPFFFEGVPKIRKALTYIKEMREHVDALLIINNERLREIYPSLTFLNAFSKADDILSTAAGSIIEIILKTGPMNCDFNDVNTTLSDGGTAIISTGYGEGEMRVTQAIENAIKSPLLRDSDVFSAKTLLMIVFLSPDESQMTLEETEQLNAFTSKFVNEPDMITGMYIDETLKGRMKITILAAGFTPNDVVSVPAEQAPKNDKKPTPVSPDVVDNADIEQMYGPDAIRDIERKRLQIAVLTRTQMENEALLEMFDSEPTYNRPLGFKQRLAEAGNVKVNNEPAVTTENNIKTINFGD